MAFTRETKVHREIDKLRKEGKSAKQIYERNSDRIVALNHTIRLIQQKKHNDLLKKIVGRYVQLNRNTYAHVLSRRKNGDRYTYTCTTITFELDGVCVVRIRDKQIYIRQAKEITEAKFFKIWNGVVDELNKGIK